jgi:hypothetical protein
MRLLALNPNPINHLRPAQCAISPLNPVFAPFVGFNVRGPYWFNNIDLSETIEKECANRRSQESSS